MFNLQGSEIIFILLIALVVLGPEKLPGAIRRATKTYAEFRKMSNSFQSEFKSVIDEPMREMRETADLLKESADPMKVAEAAEREAEAAARAEREAAARPAQQRSDAPRPRDARQPAPVEPVDESGDAPDESTVDAPDDEWADPVDSPELTADDAVGETDEANA